MKINNHVALRIYIYMLYTGCLVTNASLLSRLSRKVLYRFATIAIVNGKFAYFSLSISH